MSTTRISAVVSPELKRKAQIRAKELDQTLGQYLTLLILNELEDSGFNKRYTPVKPNGD